jgi:hypothetical protein
MILSKIAQSGGDLPKVQWFGPRPDHSKLVENIARTVFDQLMLSKAAYNRVPRTL